MIELILLLLLLPLPARYNNIMIMIIDHGSVDDGQTNSVLLFLTNLSGRRAPFRAGNSTQPSRHLSVSMVSTRSLHACIIFCSERCISTGIDHK